MSLETSRNTGGENAETFKACPTGQPSVAGTARRVSFFVRQVPTPPGYALLKPSVIGCEPGKRWPPMPDGWGLSRKKKLYLGRVGEGPHTERVSVTLWRYPTGEEYWTSLPLDVVPCPSSGMRLRVWTWFGPSGEKEFRVEELPR